MKKLLFISSAITYLLTPVRALAAEFPVNITAPDQGYKEIGPFVKNLMTIAFVVALIVVLVMLIIGAFEWIVSGGDKEAIAKARNRIINALVGLAVLAIAFALTQLGAQILGFGGITGGQLKIPGP